MAVAIPPDDQIHRPGPDGRRPGLESARAARSLHVLVAEDNAINMCLVRRILEDRGHRVSVAGDGAEAVSSWAEGSFDVICMDLGMPVLTGLEATVEIRSRERGEGGRTPIIAMTGYDGDEDRARCAVAGMDAHISKPIAAGSLIALVERAAAPTT